MLLIMQRVMRREMQRFIEIGVYKFFSIMKISKCNAMLYPTRDDQAIFVSFFLRTASLQMLAVALAMPALCALQVKKINSPKFHLSTPRGV